MIYNLIKIFCSVLLLLLLGTGLTSEIDHQYSLSHNSTARAIALGGAFTAVPDGFASMFYNPAAFGHYQYPQNMEFSIGLNPLGLGAAIGDWDVLSNSENKKGYHWIGTAGLIVKSVVFSHQSLTIGINFSESLPNNPFVQDKNKPFLAEIAIPKTSSFLIFDTV